MQQRKKKGAKKGKGKKGKDFSSEDEEVDELEKEVEEEEEDEGAEENESEEEDRTPETVKRKRQSIEENEAEVRRLEAIEADIMRKKLRLQQAVNRQTAEKVVRIKNHVPVVVTQEDVDEYGSVESAMQGGGSGKGLQRIE